jgi:hypothetical protein
MERIQINIKETIQAYDFDKIIDSINVRNCKVEKPKPIFYTDDTIIMSAGNISMIQGQAKSRKTFGLMLMNELLLKNQEVSYSVLFDTEQFMYHSSLFLQRFDRISNNSNKLYMYNLRKFSKDIRRQIIYDFIEKHRPPIVFIDNVRDIITDFNDLKEVDTILTDIVKLSEITQTHICLTLHENKKDGNARGHLGSEIVQKAETVLRISAEDETSFIECAYARNKPFETASFMITDGLPILQSGFYMPPLEHELKF